jgi:group I intron endonuclease
MHMHSVPNASGVYQILCVPTGKVYVGSSINMAERWWEHRWDLRRQTHHSRYLQRAWDKYGDEAFEFSVLENIDDQNLLMEREQLWMDITRCYERDYGYNLSREVGTTRGVKPSEETRAKMSAARKGKPKSMAHVFNQAASVAAEWILITPNGEILFIKNLNAFCRQMNLSAPALCEVASGHHKSHKGWRCIRPDSQDLEAQIARARAYIPQYSGPKSYIVTSPDGDVLRIHGLSAFCRRMSLSSGAMCNVANGKLSHHKGWKCCHIDEDI